MANAVGEGGVDRELFDASRPRLAAFDAAHPEPTAEELATPLAALTPPDWEERLAALIARALRGGGTAPEPGAGWKVGEETAWKQGPTFAAALFSAGGPDGGAAAAADVGAVASRVPLEPRRPPPLPA